jgi:hypothetical protein
MPRKKRVGRPKKVETKIEEQPVEIHVEVLKVAEPNASNILSKKHLPFFQKINEPEVENMGVVFNRHKFAVHLSYNGEGFYVPAHGRSKRLDRRGLCSLPKGVYFVPGMK